MRTISARGRRNVQPQSASKPKEGGADMGLLSRFSKLALALFVLLTLTAIPDNNFVVASWGGNCGGAGTTCDLTMSGNRTASVRFKRVTKTLTLDNQPFELNDGTGIRTSTGQFCHTHCVFTLNAGVSVTLTEVDNGLNFSGWGGDCAGSGTNTSCTLTMDTNHSVSTDFSNQGFARAAAGGPGTAEVRRSRRPRAKSRV